MVRTRASSTDGRPKGYKERETYSLSRATRNEMFLRFIRPLFFLNNSRNKSFFRSLAKKFC